MFFIYILADIEIQSICFHTIGFAFLTEYQLILILISTLISANNGRLKGHRLSNISTSLLELLIFNLIKWL